MPVNADLWRITKRPRQVVRIQNVHDLLGRLHGVPSSGAYGASAPASASEEGSLNRVTRARLTTSCRADLTIMNGRLYRPTPGSFSWPPTGCGSPLSPSPAPRALLRLEHRPRRAARPRRVDADGLGARRRAASWPPHRCQTTPSQKARRPTVDRSHFRAPTRIASTAERAVGLLDAGCSSSLPSWAPRPFLNTCSPRSSLVTRRPGS